MYRLYNIMNFGSVYQFFANIFTSMYNAIHRTNTNNEDVEPLMEVHFI